MSNNSGTCPDCNGSRIVKGRYLGQTDAGLGHVFRPSGLKTFKLSSTSSDIPISTRFQTCLDCGLLWNRADKTQVEKTIVALGTKKTKERLGYSAS